MRRSRTLPCLLVASLGFACHQSSPPSSPQPEAVGLSSIETVVVLYAENRSFDALYGSFPGAAGLAQATPAPQLDRNGTPLPVLPPIWGGLTAPGITPVINQAQTARLPNAPFAIDDAAGFHAGLGVTTRDLIHRFYQNQMQIDGGKNDKFAAYGDSGALVMGHYDGSSMKLWTTAREFTLADNFFMGVFGGSFMNHIYLACACVARYPNASTSPAMPYVAVVDPDGVSLTLAPDSPASALDGPPRFVQDGNLTPDFYAVNTMQPPYQPSYNPPASGGDPRFADPKASTTLPPQAMRTIGDLLTEKGVSWAWYSGAWQATLDGNRSPTVPNFQYHHQPFNYFEAYAPGAPARTEHLRDGGMDGQAFLKAVDAGALPAVTFYKPQGNLNEHAGYADIRAGDDHLAAVVARLRAGPQWAHMLIVVTYDENGGFWDHVAPPKGDRWGPGMRIPAIIVSPFARRGFVDHTFYDTSSILRFLTRRFGLPMLPGLTSRDAALRAAGSPPLGDLTAALNLKQR